MGHTLGRKEFQKVRFTYGLGDFYGGAGAAIVSLLFMFFLTNVAGVSPIYAGVIVFIGRVFDAVTDPLMGIISDRTRSKAGRRSPYFLWGILPLMVSFSLLWYVPSLSAGLLVVYYAVVYSIFSTVDTMIMVPYSALAQELTDDTIQRNSIVGMRMACSIIGGLVAAVVPSMIVSLYKGELQTGYIVMSLLFAVVFGLIWLMMFFVMRGREVCPVQEEGMNLKDSLRHLTGNKTFGVLVAIYLLAFIPNDITGANFKYFLNYCLLRENDFSLVVGLTMVCAVLSLPIYLTVMRRVGKPKTMLFGSLFRSVVILSYFLVNASTPLWFILIISVLNGVGMGASYAVPWAMLPEVTDYDEATTGGRNEGIYSGIMTFIRKMSTSIAMLGIGMILEWSSYVSDAPSQPDSAVTAIRLTTILAPLALSLLAAFAASRFKIGPHNIGKIRALVDSRRSGEFDKLTPEEQKRRVEEVRI